MDFRHHPEWSVQTSLDFDHKKKRTGGMLSVKLGKDLTNKNKQILLSTSVDRKIKDLRNMDIDYKIKAIVPMLVRDEIYFHLFGLFMYWLADLFISYLLIHLCFYFHTHVAK